MTIVNVIKPAGYPVTLTEAKSHLRVSDSNHDTRITAYIAAATSIVESMSELLLVEQTVRLDLDGFPDASIEIPICPVSSVVSLKYDDTSNAEQTLVQETDFFVSLGGRYPKIAPVSAWPVAYSGKIASVRVTLTAGYETAYSPVDYAENIPADLKHAVLIKLKELFDYGGETILGQEVNPSANPVSLITLPYRRWWIA